MEVFKTKFTARFARRQRITDESLIEAIERAERDLIDADLGNGLIKQRVARVGQGRSGGFRMLMVYRPRQRAVFIYGFAKNERDNIGPDELATARYLTELWLSADTRRIEQALDDDEREEIFYGDEEA